MIFGKLFHYETIEKFDDNSHCYKDCLLIKDFSDEYKFGTHVDMIFVRYKDGKLFMADYDGRALKTSNYYELH